jgi:mono/diheme cytochrome c family protein
MAFGQFNNHRTMKHVILTTCIATFFIGGFAQAAPPEARLPEKHQAFFKAHCLDCHDSDTQEGKVDLETLPFRITTIEQAELWQKVLGALNSGEMPPKDSDQPGNEQKADFLDDLALTMVTARKVLSDSGGKITMRRLNKRDYQNSIQSLLGVRLGKELLPDDGSSGDFDTVGASLFLSSDKFQQYLKLGRHAIDEFYERKAARTAKPFVYRVEPEETLNVALRERVERNEEYLKRHEALDTELDQALALPENKGFEAQMGTKGNRLQLYRKIDGHLEKLKGAPNPKDFGFKSFFGAAKFFPKAAPYDKHYVGLPHSETGTWLQLTMGSAKIVIAPPNEMPVGTYTLRIMAGVTKESPAFRHFLELGHPAIKGLARGQLNGFPLKALHVTGSPANPKLIETQVTVGKDTKREFAIRERQPAWGPLRKHYFYPAMNRNGYGHEPSIWIDWVEIEGPLPQRERSPLDEIFKANPAVRTPSDLKRARNILHQFAVKAFREREPKPEFIDSLVEVFKNRLVIDKEFDLAIRTPLSMILASPRFLFMKEPGQDGAPRALSDLELAVRLSYFLWSSPPDSQLIALAKKKQLRDPAVLRGQVDRLIQDPRSHHFVSGLAHQWLDMKRLDFFQFDAKLHREFDESMRSAAREEVYQSILHLLRANGNPKRARGTGPAPGSIGNLLKSNYVIINGLLAAHYGLDGVVGDYYRKVSLPENSPRGGLLGMAAISAMGSDGTESSPVERGAWVLRHLLHAPPPPAPANVPQLSVLDGKSLTKREKLAAHMEEAQCASCHRKMDPIGFGLENFDAAGKWRSEEHYYTKNRKGQMVPSRTATPIDTSGAFHNGPAFADFFELRDLIATWRTKKLARAFTEALIEYGLGRPFGFTDEDLANEILAASNDKQYAVREFIHALVQSKPFQSK